MKQNWYAEAHCWSGNQVAKGLNIKCCKCCGTVTVGVNIGGNSDWRERKWFKGIWFGFWRVRWQEKGIKSSYSARFFFIKIYKKETSQHFLGLEKVLDHRKNPGLKLNNPQLFPRLLSKSYFKNTITALNYLKLSFLLTRRSLDLHSWKKKCNPSIDMSWKKNCKENKVVDDKSALISSIVLKKYY